MEYLEENGIEVIGVYHNHKPYYSVKKIFSCQLINYAEKKKVRTFIYISSISVYGETLSVVNEAFVSREIDSIIERFAEDMKI